MFLSGIGDEAGASLDAQIAATHALGWRHIEMRAVELPGIPKANFHDIPDDAFRRAADQIEGAGLQVSCFGSAIGNWAKAIEDPFDITLAEVRRCLPRLQRLGTRFIRIMSYRVRAADDQLPQERFRRLREITRMFSDIGVQAVHENCMNYGGMSPEHALRLLDAVPDLKWVFDTANPVFNVDHSKPEPRPRQDPWEFYQAVKPWVVHVHIKDARWNPARNDADYTWPGEGEGAVRRIVQDLLASGYAGGFAIEPHMVAVFHDADKQVNPAALRENFISYGRRLEFLVKAVS